MSEVKLEKRTHGEKKGAKQALISNKDICKDGLVCLLGCVSVLTLASIGSLPSFFYYFKFYNEF